MTKLYVAFLLDLFQPVTQSTDVIDRVTRECYQPLVDFINTKSNAKFSVSLANSLASLLDSQGQNKIIEGLRKAVDDGKIEMMHTGAHHAIFPLIPESEVKRQIKLDMDIKKEQFGLTHNMGILSPELCHSDNLLPLYKDLKFQWTVIDDEVMEMNGIHPPANEILCVDGFGVFMRSRLWTNWIKEPDEMRMSGRKFVELLGAQAARQDKDSYLIIALSGETFGHHISFYQETFLRDMCCNLTRSPSVELCLISELWKNKSLNKVEKKEEQGKDFKYFPSCSYGTQEWDYHRNDYYPHWKSPGNPIHENLWKLTDLILNASKNEKIDFSKTSHKGLRKLLDSAFYSTQYSHASIWDWNPWEVYRGIDIQMRAFYQCVEIIGDLDLLKKGESIYTQLMWEIFQEDQNRQGESAKRKGMDVGEWKNLKKTTLEKLNKLDMSIDTFREVHMRY